MSDPVFEDVLMRNQELRAALEKAEADYQTLVRHVAEDDRDLNELLEERDTLEAQLADAREAIRQDDEEYRSLKAQLAEALRERDAYKKAKAENDERFMRERDEAREQLAEAQKEVERLAAACDDNEAELEDVQDKHETAVQHLTAAVAKLQNAERAKDELAHEWELACGDYSPEDGIERMAKAMGAFLAAFATRDATEASKVCCCGNPTSPGVTHRQDGPCFVTEASKEPCQKCVSGNVHLDWCACVCHPYNAADKAGEEGSR
jgi:DNA repair exonuclease SbcCD ATPase subunit